LDADMHTTLLDLKDRTGTGVDRQEAQAAIEEAKHTVEEARHTVVGDLYSLDPIFKLELMRGLLETSIVEYAEAVSDGTIHEMAEFQDGSAFVWRSQQILEEIESAIDADVYAGMTTEFDALNAAYGAMDDPSEITKITESIINSIDESVGVSDVQYTKEERLLQYVDRIRILLADAKIAYNEGDADLAKSYATKAYLDNFEFLEMPLVDAGERELMLEIEHMMREELRGMIADGESPEAVGAQIDAILLRMDTVAVVVPEFGAMAIVVLAVAIILVMAVVMRTKMMAAPSYAPTVTR